jgi:hypothetical protein
MDQTRKRNLDQSETEKIKKVVLKQKQISQDVGGGV